MNVNSKTLKFTQISLLSALMIVMALVPFLGYIRIPFTTINATTMHIPVIIGAILLGPKSGAFLGAIFGLTSFITNSFVAPTPTSFLFTPLYSAGGVHGNFWSLVICFVPRILIGVAAGYVFILIKKIDKTRVFACAAAGLCGSMINTILVMGGAYLFFSNEYAAAKQTTIAGLVNIIITVITVNGVLEAIVAAVLATIVARPLMAFLNKR